MSEEPSLEKFARSIIGLEKSLRAAIKEVLADRFGSDWWRTRAAPLVPRFQRTWTYKSRNRPESGGNTPEEFIGLSEASRIITASSRGVDNWPFFKPIFPIKRGKLQELLRSIADTRNEVLHGRTLWDALPPHRSGKVIGACEWVIKHIEALPGQELFRKTGEILEIFELASLIEQVAGESGEKKFRLTNRADELFAEAIESKILDSTDEETAEEILQSAAIFLVLSIFGWTEIGGPIGISLREDIVSDYYNAFRIFQSGRWQGFIELVDEMRADRGRMGV